MRASSISIALALGLGCNGAGDGSDGNDGSGGSGGTGMEATGPGSATGATTDVVDGTAEGGSGSATDDDSGTDTGEVDCEPVGPWPNGADDPLLISRYADGMPLGSAGSTWLSGDGRYVAFTSIAPATEDTPVDNLFSIFVYDARCDLMRWVPFDPPPRPVTEAVDPVISDDGSTVVFATRDSEMMGHMYAVDLADGSIEPIDVDADGVQQGVPAWHFEVSGDGRLVVFQTDSQLVPEDQNDFNDIYLRDRDTGTTERITVKADGSDTDSWSDAPSMSADGRFIAFSSSVPGLIPGQGGFVEVYLVDREMGTIEIVSRPEGSTDFGSSGQPSVSDDGRFVAFFTDVNDLVGDDTNDVGDVFVTDRQRNTITRASVASDGSELTTPSWGPELSGDGSVVVFGSGVLAAGSNEHQIFAKDLGTGELRRISENAAGEAASSFAVMGRVSADGQWASFETQATNLAPDVMPFGWGAYMVRLF